MNLLPKIKSLYSPAILLIIAAAMLPVLVVKTQQRQESKVLAYTNSVDLDITYIERTPKYYRYQIEYSGGLPKLKPGTENNKYWPDPGETVTYTARVKNKGHLKSPAFSYNWLVDNSVVASGSGISLDSQQETTVEYQMTWLDNPQTIELQLDPDNTFPEISKTNNTLLIRSNDVAISYWIEKGYCDLLDTTLNMVNTYSCEDWIQAHISKMNERFTEAKYLSSPNGILDRLRIDRIIIAEELDGPASLMKSDPYENFLDGRWLTTDGDPTNAKGKNGEYQRYVNAYYSTFDWGILHEITHQFGIIDLYHMNIVPEPQTNYRVDVLDINGQKIPLSKLPTPRSSPEVWKSPGIMGGGETGPYNNSTYYDDHTAGGLNSNHNKRKGYFGEYLFDTPRVNYLKVIDKYQNPITNANVALYQKDAARGESFDNTPEITGKTDDLGLMLLSNQEAPSLTTATGHTLRPNPFGIINVVGTNSTMIAKVTKGVEEGYGIFLLYTLNMAYWNGQTDIATHTLLTSFPSTFSQADVVPPEIKVNYPSEGIKLLSTQSGFDISVQTSDKSGISSLTIAVDGVVKKSCGPANPSSTVYCKYYLKTSTITPGRHTIKFVAIDKAVPNQNVSSVIRTIEK